MDNILANFDWTALLDSYNFLCRSFVSKSKKPTALSCLSTFQPIPPTDIELYRQLISRFNSEKNCPNGISFSCYTAMLFWKMNSTHPEFPKPLLRQRSQTEAELKRLFQDNTFREPISKDADKVIELFRRLDGNQIHGMKGKCCFAVRTTFLHFLFPEIVPIMDVMTLAATDKTEQSAGTDERNLKPYFEMVWRLQEKNSCATGETFKDYPESPVRLTEMALFVVGHAIRKAARSRRRKLRFSS
jgi:hypothetical protein